MSTAPEDSPQWFVVIDDATGEALSFGTTVADELPAGRVAIGLPHDPAGFSWDAAARELVPAGEDADGDGAPDAPVDPLQSIQDTLDFLVMLATDTATDTATETEGGAA